MPELDLPTAPDEVAPGIWRMIFPIPSFLKKVNVYVFRDAEGYAFVDCGMDNDECWAALEQQLAALDVPITAIHTIVATHGHPDHTGMANRIRAQSDAEVWLHGSELPFIQYRRGDSSADLLHAWLLRFGVPEDEAVGMTGSVREGDKNTPDVQPTRIFEGGEELRIGDYRFEVQWTPGHTPGHVCLYDPNKRVLLSGDHILQDVTPNVSLQPFSDENPMPGYIASLEWLAELPIEETLPGHGLPFPSPSDRARKLVSFQLERQAYVRTLLTTQPRTSWELAAHVWADTKPNNWEQFAPRIRRNAMATLAAHLELLAERGEARRIEDGVVAYAATG